MGRRPPAEVTSPTGGLHCSLAPIQVTSAVGETRPHCGHDVPATRTSRPSLPRTSIRPLEHRSNPTRPLSIIDRHYPLTKYSYADALIGAITPPMKNAIATFSWDVRRDRMVSF